MSSDRGRTFSPSCSPVLRPRRKLWVPAPFDKLRPCRKESTLVVEHPPFSGVFSTFPQPSSATESDNRFSKHRLSRGPLDLRQNVLTLHLTKNFSPLDDFRFATIMPREIATSRRPLSDQPTTANDPRPGHRNFDRSHTRATTTPQDHATGRHRPSPRSDSPLLPRRTPPHPQSHPPTLATRTLPSRLSPPRRSTLPHRSAPARIVLLRNLLLSREPLYGVGEWAADDHPPDLWDSHTNRSSPSTMIASRCSRPALSERLWLPRLDRRYTRHPRVRCRSRRAPQRLHHHHLPRRIQEADKARRNVEGSDPARDHLGPNKDHRPDLKQFLFILTISKDGGIPVYSRPRAATPPTI